jgi:hypothetical protein
MDLRHRFHEIHAKVALRTHLSPPPSSKRRRLSRLRLPADERQRRREAPDREARVGISSLEFFGPRCGRPPRTRRSPHRRNGARPCSPCGRAGRAISSAAWDGSSGLGPGSPPRREARFPSASWPRRCPLRFSGHGGDALPVGFRGEVLVVAYRGNCGQGER